tara:strand:- start:1747 stop:2163 length:417 start_codon:yes stop_codon:yes gene_type:complete
MIKFHKKYSEKTSQKNTQKTRKKTSEKRRDFARTRVARSRADLVRIWRSLARIWRIAARPDPRRGIFAQEFQVMARGPLVISTECASMRRAAGRISGAGCVSIDKKKAPFPGPFLVVRVILPDPLEISCQYIDASVYA